MEVQEIKGSGGEGGIQTLDTGFSPYNGLANRRLRPLGHLTARTSSIRSSCADADFESGRRLGTSRLRLSSRSCAAPLPPVCGTPSVARRATAARRTYP